MQAAGKVGEREGEFCSKAGAAEIRNQRTAKQAGKEGGQQMFAHPAREAGERGILRRSPEAA